MDASVVAGLPAWVGKRVVIRYRLADGRASDALGTLLSVGPESLQVHRDRVEVAAATVDIALTDIVLAKRVPPPPAKRR